MARGAIDSVLSPFETADWPGFLTRLALDRARDYVILAYLPPRVPFDMRSPDQARASLLRLLSNPVALALSPAWIGHLVVGWQCGGQRGITSHTGDPARRALWLLARGWGLSAVLATFEDGRLVPADAFCKRQDRAFAAGQGAVLAAEVETSGCRALRARLAGFANSPNVNRYGLREDPWRGTGAGCLSLGAYLAEAAQVPGVPGDAFSRDVAVPEDLVGLRPAAKGVFPYRPSHLSGATAARSVSLLRLLSQPWEGAASEVLRLPDGEAFFSALVAPREGVSGPSDWRFGRALPENDAVIARVASGARAWAADYSVRRIADPGGVAALVLER